MQLAEFLQQLNSFSKDIPASLQKTRGQINALAVVLDELSSYQP
jgi:hypothetical protein